MTTLQIRNREALIAFNRFGLGAKRNEFETIVADPRGAVLAELESPGIRLMHGETELPNHVNACAASATASISREIFQAEVSARLRKHLRPRIGFVERLVLFWSNHFNVSANSGGPARSAVGEMERHRIRQNVLGNFRGLLQSVITHPAMIHYLQNGLSVGPNSAFGRQTGRGLNENLAREILELHTVGVSAGFTQLDVENTAKILTGWSIVTPWHARNNWQGATPETTGQFIFRNNWQEPTSGQVLGQSYVQTGIAKGRSLLQNLAVDPATAQHIAYKLVKHFITDNPTPDMVRPVARAFLRGDGDLTETYRALLALPEAWLNPMTKIRTPYELFVAQRRGIGADWISSDVATLMSALASLGNRPWDWDPPDGYPDDSAFWNTPSAIWCRIAATQVIMRRLFDRREERSTALQIAQGLLGANLTVTTENELRQEQHTLRSLTCLFLSPEFQRR